MFRGGIDTFTLVINYLNKIWTWSNHAIIGIFEVHEKQPCHDFVTLIFVRKKWVNLSCEIAFVKYENNNLGTMVLILWWIIHYEPFNFLWVYEGTCFGYVMSKACQYAMNDDNVFVCLILMNV